MGEIVGLITARGGSKEVPRKNVLPVAGRPLIAWTVEAAVEAQGLDRVIVSTDDPEIAQVCREWGAEVPFMRPPELSRDDTPHMPVMVHAVRWMEAHWGRAPEYVLLLQPTSPLRTAQDIDGAIQVARRTDADSVVSVCEAKEHPYLIKTVSEDGALVDFIPGANLETRQLGPKVYFVNGAIYLTRSRVLVEEQTFYPRRVYAYVMPRERSLQVDTLWDLELVRRVMEARNSGDPSASEAAAPGGSP